MRAGTPQTQSEIGPFKTFYCASLKNKTVEHYSTTHSVVVESVYDKGPCKKLYL